MTADVMKHSDALDLKEGIFSSRSPRKIAAFLKHSAKASKRRKSTPYRSARSMLSFYINRAGKTLSANQNRILEGAKDELRTMFGAVVLPRARKGSPTKQRSRHA